MTTRILTASVENHRATAAHGFSVIGLKERRRLQALDVQEGDRFVLYLTKVMAFAGSITVTGDLFEDRAKLWPGKPGKADAYPWRFPTVPEVVLEEPDWVPAEELVDSLDLWGTPPTSSPGGSEHPRYSRWPKEHWKLAFQGQVRPVSEHDAEVLLGRMRHGSPALGR